MKAINKVELSKICIIGLLLVICLLLIWYFHFILRSDIVFSHFFYVPVTLAGIWWSRRGIAVAIFLALMLLIMHILSPVEAGIRADVIRSFMFVFVGTLVAVLNQQKSLLVGKLCSDSETLEQKVEERTRDIGDLKEQRDAILESIDDAFIVLDKEFNIIEANKVAIGRHGFILGKKCYEVLKHLEEPCPDCIARKTFTDGTVKSIEKDLILKNGNQTNFIVTCSPVRDRDGTIVSVMEFFHDITERKHAEEVIIAKNRDLSFMYSAAAIAARSSGLDKLLDGTLRTMLEHLGITVGWVCLINEENGKAVLRAQQGLPAGCTENVCCASLDTPSLAERLESEKPVIAKDMPCCCKKPATIKEDGIEKVVIFQLRAREKVIGFVSLSVPEEREVSEEEMRVLESIANQAGIAVENIRLFEKTKKAYEELKSLDRMKDEFISNVSHELRTPLTSIGGYSELMHDEILGPLTDPQKKAVDAVVRNTDRLRRLIDSLLYLSLARSGKIKYAFSPLRITEVIDQVIQDIYPQIEKKGLEIEKDMPDDLPLIKGDKNRLIEVLFNLISNAVKFTPSGGRITVAVHEENDNLHIMVKDTGTGIPEDRIADMFLKFHQLDASMARKYGGTGLGLYICKILVDAHDGKIWMESEENVGTTVHVMLPKHDLN